MTDTSTPFLTDQEQEFLVDARTMLQRIADRNRLVFGGGFERGVVYSYANAAALAITDTLSSAAAWGRVPEPQSIRADLEVVGASDGE